MIYKKMILKNYLTLFFEKKEKKKRKKREYIYRANSSFKFFIFQRQFRPMAFTFDDYLLLLDKDTNWFFVQARIES